MSVPMVRNEHGAILGIDFRQSPLADPSVKVPGTIPARAVMPGDGVRIDGIRGTVRKVIGGNTPPDRLHIIARTRGGADVVHEVGPHDLVDVVTVGGFDPEARS